MYTKGFSIDFSHPVVLDQRFTANGASDGELVTSTCIWVSESGTAGNVTWVNSDGDNQVTPVSPGGVYYIAAIKVNTTGTTATGLTYGASRMFAQ